MTLRYAELTQKTLSEEFSRAMANIKKEYKGSALAPDEQKFSPIEKLNEVSAWLKNQDQILQKVKTKYQKKISQLLKELPLVIANKDFLK